jgi:hypothetical protein
MKTPFSNYILCCIFLTAATLFGSCKGEPLCPDAKDVYRGILSSERVLFPYDGFDTLRFKQLAGDTVKFTSDVLLSQYKLYRYVRNSNPDCDVYDKHFYEELMCTLNALDNQKIVFNLSSEFGTATVTCLGVNFYFDIYHLSKRDNEKEDSILINNVWHHNHKIFTTNNDTLIVNETSGILICKNSTTGNRITLIK